MESASEFLATIWSNLVSRMTGLASIAVPAIAYAAGVDEKELWWATAYLLLLWSAFRTWQLEYQKPGPQIIALCQTRERKRFEEMGVLEYMESENRKGIEGSRNGPLHFVLENLSDVPAINVTVGDIELAGNTARFTVAPRIVKGQPIEVMATIEQFGVLQMNDLRSFLNKGVKDNLEDIVVPVTISYADTHGREFETACEIKHNFWVTTTYMKPDGYRRVSRRTKWLIRRH